MNSIRSLPVFVFASQVQIVCTFDTTSLLAACCSHCGLLTQTSTMLPLSWIVSALLLSSTQAAFQCFLDRNGYSCANQGSVYKEFMCVSKENSMSDIMACVKPIDLKNDVQLCRDVSATSGDLDVNLYDGLPNRYCLEPRDVLEFQSTKPQLCNGCKLRGAILACPKQDKAFANCICSHSGPIQKAVNCLSTCFKNVPEDFLSCTNRPVTSLGQRDSPRNEIEAESPSKVSRH